jgi:hypothetical protein
MMRIGTTSLVWIAACGFAISAAAIQAQTTAPGLRIAQATQASTSEGSTTARRPARLRVYPSQRPEPDGVYPRYFPGRNAVRDCSVSYVQEYRPSGTVITPRMHCFWRQG